MYWSTPITTSKLIESMSSIDRLQNELSCATKYSRVRHLLCEISRGKRKLARLFMHIKIECLEGQNSSNNGSHIPTIYVIFF